MYVENLNVSRLELNVLLSINPPHFFKIMKLFNNFECAIILNANVNANTY